MDEIKETKQDSTQETDQTSASEKESTSKKPQTYTEETQEKAISDALAAQGRDHKTELKSVITERDTFKSQVTQLEVDVEEAATSKGESESRISELESDLDTATEDNVDLKEIQKIKKELRGERANARQDASDGRKANAELKRTLEAERLEHAGEVAEARAARFEVDVFEVAEGYVDAAGQAIRSDRLKALCEKAGQVKRSDIQELADTLWKKKSEDNLVVEGDSGVTGGGGLSDKAFIQRIGSGEGDLTKADLDRAKKLGILT